VKTPTRRSSRLVLSAFVAGLSALFLYSGETGATVEEQRARLPPPAACKDPVEGTWMAHKFEPRFSEWYIFTMQVRRAAPGSADLTGDVLSHFWTGAPGEQNPPTCSPGRLHAKVTMPGKGTIQPDGKIEFGGTTWVRAPGPCDAESRGVMYNPDHFSGTIDPALQEFQSVNNDGGRAVNEPVVFRRVRCFDPAAPPAPTVNVTPPPIAPPKHRGCGRS
jgi:hypothetical protein